MEAERHRQDETKFRELLGSSISSLNRAIRTFPQVTELSDAARNAEVGDCQSLLGRTYFVAGDLVKAKKVVRKAIDQITDVNSKDYADLQILLGDLAYANKDTQAAVNFYDAAISAASTVDAERSEIVARALFQKETRPRRKTRLTGRQRYGRNSKNMNLPMLPDGATCCLTEASHLSLNKLLEMKALQYALKLFDCMRLDSKG